MEKKPCILSARLLLFLYPKLNLRKNPLTAHASAPRRVRPPGQSAPKPHAEQRRAAELSDSAKPSAPPRPSARGHRVKAPHNLSQSDAEPQRASRQRVRIPPSAGHKLLPAAYIDAAWNRRAHSTSHNIINIRF